MWAIWGRIKYLGQEHGEGKGGEGARVDRFKYLMRLAYRLISIKSINHKLKHDLVVGTTYSERGRIHVPKT
jgi:hypothetical protein